MNEYNADNAPVMEYTGTVPYWRKKRSSNTCNLSEGGGRFNLFISGALCVTQKISAYLYSTLR